MSAYKLEKNLIFYHAGESGPVFTYPAGQNDDRNHAQGNIKQPETKHSAKSRMG